jgi:Gas vesicle protein
MNGAHPAISTGSQGSLADILERVLDKGVVIVGDIVVSVLDVELLSLKLRLFVASAQTAQEMGLDWWTRDPFFTSGAPAPVSRSGAAAPLEPPLPAPALERTASELTAENADLRRRITALEQQFGIGLADQKLQA